MTPAVPKRGRPRLRPTDSDQDPAEQILEAAATSFIAKGYAATSLTAIARDVGLQRASLYHHFANKEAMLAEIARRHVDPLLGLLATFGAEDRSPALQLHRYLRIDLRHMLRAPYDLGALFHLPEVRDRSRFAVLWDAIDEINEVWTGWIHDAADAGTFDVEDPSLAGLLLESSYFGILSTPRRRLRDDPAATADAFARSVLDGLLADRAHGECISRRAVQLDGPDPSLPPPSRG